MKNKKLLSILTTIAVVAGCLPGFVCADNDVVDAETNTEVTEETNSAEEPQSESYEVDESIASVSPAYANDTPESNNTEIEYIDRTWDLTNQCVVETVVTTSDYISLSEGISGEVIAPGVYFVSADYTIEHRVYVNDNQTVTLILADGVTLTCNGGIGVNPGATLNIYGQSNDSGSLVSTAMTNCAAIGGSSLLDSGSINIYGGTVIATGNSSAGIGGSAPRSSGVIKVYGGNVTATGNSGYAGIGGGRSCIANDISIYGGCITATGASAPAIGGDTLASDPIIIDIYGGSITANGWFGGPNIGACSGEFNGQVIISGGSITLPVRYAPYIGNGTGQYSNTPLIINAGVSVLDGNTCVDCGNRVSICTAASTDSSNTLNIVPCQHSHFTDGICDYCGFEVGNSAQFIGHAMQLTGEIGLQFYVKLPTDSAEGYYMTFEGQGMDPANQVELVADSDKTGVENSFYALINLSSIQMAESFIPTLHCPDGSCIQGSSYSAQDYIAWGKDNGSIDSNERNIIRALGDYGYFAQRYLSTLRSWSLGTDYAAMTVRGSDEDYSLRYDVFREWIAEHATSGTFNSNNGYFASATFNLKFDSLVTMYVYLTPIDGVSIDTSLISQGYSVEQLSDGRILITFPDLPIDALDNIIHINYGNTNTPVVEISPLTYIYTAIGSSSSMSSDGKNMVCSLFRLFAGVVYPTTG